MNQNMLQMMKEFSEFKNSFRGNPREEVMKLMQSGKISQKDLNDLQRMASELQNILK